MSEQEQDEQHKGSFAEDAAVNGVAEAGCCLLNALTVLALFLSVSTLLLVNL